MNLGCFGMECLTSLFFLDGRTGVAKNSLSNTFFNVIIQQFMKTATRAHHWKKKNVKGEHCNFFTGLCSYCCLASNIKHLSTSCVLLRNEN